jgi:hypothetical protein
VAKPAGIRARPLRGPVKFVVKSAMVGIVLRPSLGKLSGRRLEADPHHRGSEQQDLRLSRYLGGDHSGFFYASEKLSPPPPMEVRHATADASQRRHVALAGG